MMACLPMNDKVVDITQSTETADAPKTKVYRSMIGNGRISPATRQRVLDYVKEKLGHLPADRMQRKDVIRGQQANKDAVRFANYIVPDLGLTNTEFHVGKAEVVVPELYAQGYRADVVVVDPPRKGCERVVLDTILQMAPRTLVYVSCDPGSLARDLAYLLAHGYRLDAVQPVDMFPHTLHVETVVRLRRD